MSHKLILNFVPVESTSPLLKMKVIYLSEKTEFGNFQLVEAQKQNKYGTMYMLGEKLEIVSTQNINDYYVFKNEHGKVFLVLKNDSQIGDALKKISESLTKEHGLSFKPEKDKVYIHISDEQAASFPKNSNLLISVKVYGVFVQHRAEIAFVQSEVSGFQATPLIDFNAAFHANPVFQ